MGNPARPGRVPAYASAVHLYAELEEINERPRPFSRSTTQQLWTEPHLAEQMLRAHLDQGQDVASRNAGFISRSVQWIAETFAVGSGSAVLDLGCGPGLYANRIARTGAQVTGVDFSRHSLDFAEAAAADEGLPVSYVEASYLGWQPQAPADLVLMTMCDFGTLAPEQRAEVLATVRDTLRAGGAFLFDVHSPAYFAAAHEAVGYSWAPSGGFWSAEPYFVFENTLKYDGASVLLERFEVVERSRRRTFYNWTQCFDADALADELGEAGMRVEQVVGSVAGDPPDRSAGEFAVVARRA